MKKIYFNTKLILLAILINLTGVVCAQINITLGTGTAAHSNTDAGP